MYNSNNNAFLFISYNDDASKLCKSHGNLDKMHCVPDFSSDSCSCKDEKIQQIDNKLCNRTCFSSALFLCCPMIEQQPLTNGQRLNV